MRNSAGAARRFSLLVAAGAAVALSGATLQARQDAGDPSGAPPSTPPGPQPEPAATEPKAQPDKQPPPPPVTPGMITFTFTNDVELTLLVNFVRDELGIQIVYADAGLQGQKVVLTAPVTVPKEKVLQFLTFLLEQKNYTIVRNELGIYMVQPSQGVGAGGVKGDDPFSPTQVIPTPGIKPSSLSSAIQALGTAQGGAVVPLDEIGVLLVTDSPRRTQMIRDLVERLVKEREQVSYQRYEVQHIAASTALDRILALIGESGAGPGPLSAAQPTPGGKGPAGQGSVQAQAFGASGALSSLGAQLSVDPQSNALLFRGRASDGHFVESLLKIVDVPNSLVSEWYPVAGRTAEAVAAAGAREGLGDVTVYESGQPSTRQPGGLPTPQQQPQRQQSQQTQQQALIGSGFVIYPESGGFMYHGTETQHARVKELVKNLEPLTKGEELVYEFYKLKHAKAEDVADIVQNLISGQVPSGNRGNILGRDLGQGTDRNRSRRDRSNRQNRTTPAADQRQPTPGAGGSAQGAIVGDEDTFVLADDKNNQIVVKALQRLQPQFKNLIDKIDLRRPQVYINAQIVAVTSTEEFRLAFETQIVSGQFGVNTNFGLGTIASGGITGNKVVNTGLGGLTAAVIKSEYVPIIITALQNNVDTRILATPQLLVDANEAASVSSENVVPTQVSSQSNATTITSVGESARAGTTLSVTPQISESSVKMDLEITQSSFTGSAAAAGLPPPSQENTITSASVTVPPDSTIVVGGLTLESTAKTIIKVPLLGDIPLVGQLFRDTRNSLQRTTLYVFITPTIMRDPNFADLRLLTQRPLAESNLKASDYIPPPEPVKMRILETPPPRDTDLGVNTVERRRRRP